MSEDEALPKRTDEVLPDASAPSEPESGAKDEIDAVAEPAVASPLEPSSSDAVATSEASDPDETPPSYTGEGDTKISATFVTVAEEEDVEVPPLVDDTATGLARFIPLAIAVAVPLLLFFVLPPLTRSGLWDPYELNVADLARRVALNLHDAQSLALDGADNSLPHLNDLGRPQLPFTSIAIGFKLFGLHEWAGRAPLALWGVLGVLATYLSIARLFDRRAGVYSAVALATMPLYFVQARSMFGDVCTMSALAMAFGGLAVAVFDADERGPTRLVSRLPWVLMAGVGLAAGYGSRGGILGLAVPALGVGLAWALSLGSGQRRGDLVGDAIGSATIALGGYALFQGVAVLSMDKPSKDLSLWVGAMVKTQPKYPTFDFFIANIGHALAPWSAFVPFAFGRLFQSPVGRVGAIHQRESFARMALLIAATCVFAVHGMMAAKTDLIAFAGPALCAAACGVAIRDYERGAHASVAVGVGTLVLCGVFHHDFHELPDKAYQVYAVVGAAFPESFKATALKLWWAVLGGFAVLAFLTWVERGSKREPFEPKTYIRILRALREAFDGILALIYMALVAGLAILGLVLWVGVRTQGKWMPTMSGQVRDAAMNAWWVVAFVPLGVILGIVFACDVWLWAFNRSRPFTKGSFSRGFEPFEGLARRVRSEGDFVERVASGAMLAVMGLGLPLVVGFVLVSTQTVRWWTGVALALPLGIGTFLLLGMLGDALRHRAPALTLGGAVVGTVLCVFYFPALANQLSPKEVFETYQRVHSQDEPLALLGVGGRTAAYYAGGQPTSFTDPQAAYAWLMAGDKRRFLATRADELPRLNQVYRQSSEPRANLPVIDARSSQILLVASSIGANEKNENPLNRIILSAPPKPQRKVEVNLDDKLEVLGVDIIEQASSKLVEVVAPGRKYVLRTYYRVLAPVGGEWEAFIHIDGQKRRHNGDHKVMNGKYAMSLWLKDDIVMDEHEFALEPNFTPGSYSIYFGLFVGDTRMKVKSGPSDGDNRIQGGPLRVQ